MDSPLENVDKDIAVIGMSGRFPQANTVEQLWDRLINGEDCITEVPPERWDNNIYYAQETGNIETSQCKWGGFINNVDCFDPLFFKIAPKMADFLDPNERLYLEGVWNLLESTGNTREKIQTMYRGNVGVFVGMMHQEYHHFAEKQYEKFAMAGLSRAIVANRVSHFFNFTGPSLGIDTLCSSSMTAIHQACQSLLQGDCKLAIAGGVNLSLHPSKYILYSQGKMLASSKNSRSFSQGDGFIPSEAIANVLLKPLAQAKEDGDNILAVIKATKVNHGGYSNWMFAPNRNALIALMKETITASQVDIRTISYIEAAANGSAIGDKVEFEALKKVFKQDNKQPYVCKLGTVKSNIGHSEAASGVCQLIKVILQFQHKQLVPGIKLDKLNSKLKFKNTPLVLQNTLQAWHNLHQDIQLPNGDYVRKIIPNRVLINSIGAAGSNAALICEQYIDDKQAYPIKSNIITKSFYIPLSAKSESGLVLVVEALLNYLTVDERQKKISLVNLAYTLQLGREAMEYRLIIAVNNISELLISLTEYIKRKDKFITEVLPIASGSRFMSADTTLTTVQMNKTLLGKTGRALAASYINNNDINSLLKHWSLGGHVVWQALYPDFQQKIINLPTYPFNKVSCWLSGSALPFTSLVDNVKGTKLNVIGGGGEKSDVLMTLQTLIGKELGVSLTDLNVNKPLTDFGLDSISGMNIVSAIEDIFNVKLTGREMLATTTINLMVDLLQAKSSFIDNKRVGDKHIGSESDSSSGAMAVFDLALKKTQQVTDYPLSANQQALWLSYQRNPLVSTYNVPMAFRLAEYLDVELFKKSCQFLLVAYPLLSTVIQVKNDTVSQHVISDPEQRKQAVVLDHLVVSLNFDEITALIDEKVKMPMVLEQGALFRALLINNGEQESFVVFTVHHIIVDGLSSVLLMKSFIKAYQSYKQKRVPQVEPTKLAYQDFVTWQQEMLSSLQGQQHLDFWKNHLAEKFPVLALPSTYQRSKNLLINSVSQSLNLPLDLSDRIRQGAKQDKINLSVFFLTLYKIFLHKYTGENNIQVGMPVIGRPHRDYANVLGYFVNMLVMRTEINSDLDYRTLAQNIQLSLVDCLDHSDYPLHCLLKQLAEENQLNDYQLYQVTFAYQNFVKLDDYNSVANIDLAAMPELLDSIVQDGTTEFGIEIYEKEQGFTLVIKNNSHLFDHETIEKMLTHYVQLIVNVLDDLSMPISQLTMLTDLENQQQRWQRKLLTGDFLARQQAYWQTQLSGIPTVHRLPTDYLRPLQQTFQTSTYVKNLSLSLTQQIEHLAQQQDSTLFIVLQTAFALLLHRYSFDNDIVMGTPVAVRSDCNSDPLLDVFVNRLVLRTNIKSNQRFIDLLAINKKMILAAYENRYLPFDMVVDLCQPERSTSYTPLCQILFTLNMDEEDSIVGRSMHQPLQSARDKSTLDLELVINVNARQLSCHWSYNTCLFAPASIKRMANVFEQVLKAVTDDVERPLDQLSLLSAQELACLPAGISNNSKNNTRTCIHQCFEVHAKQNPQAIALICNEQQLTYQVLNEKSNQLAYLLLASGVTVNSLVGICVERNQYLIISILAVLKSGCAYVPLDPINPKSRLDYIIENSNISYVLTHSLTQEFSWENDLQLIYLDATSVQNTLAQYPCSNLNHLVVNLNSLAYVIYTSGSTGQPKGVMVEHGNIARLMAVAKNDFSFSADDVWSLFHSYAFDFSVWEIWGALAYGGRLVIVPVEVTKSAQEFYQFIQQYGITVLNQTPSSFYRLSDEIVQSKREFTLRYVIFGGEKLNVKRLRPWMNSYGDHRPYLINMYGITETTVHVTFRRIVAADTQYATSVIGRPLADLTCYVVNKTNALQPMGAWGELLVAGAGVTRGYINQDRLSAQRFLKDPFNDNNQKVYRSGDIVRWKAVNELEYFGRCDQQIKLRGYRLELGEIEAQMLLHKDIKTCSVLIEGQHADEQRLIAFVVLDTTVTDHNRFSKQIRQVLGESLPIYMIPAAIVPIDILPLTANGKIDQQALFTVYQQFSQSRNYIAPSNTTEAILCEIYSQVLNIEAVSIDDNFFELGGDSIRVIAIIKAAAKKQLILSIEDIFTHQTIAELARYCQTKMLAEQTDLAPAPLALLTEFEQLSIARGDDKQACYPVNDMQSLMLQQHKKGHGIYHPVHWLDIDSDNFSAEILAQAFVYMVNKHPTLRTRFFTYLDNEYIQVVQTTLSECLHIYDLSTDNHVMQEKKIEEICQLERDTPFELEQLNFRFKLYKRSSSSWGLLLSTHHAIEDGWGLIQFLGELLITYQKIKLGENLVSIEPKVNVFREQIALELEAATVLEHHKAWQALLADFQCLPKCSVVTYSEKSESQQLAFCLSKDKVADLTLFAQQRKVQLKTLLMVAYYRVIGELVSTNHVTIDIVSSGRSPRLSDPLYSLGLFWRFLPIPIVLSNNNNELIDTVSTKMWQANAHALYPLYKIKQITAVDNMTYVSFNYVNFSGGVASQKGSDVVIKKRYFSDRFHHAIQLAISLNEATEELDCYLDFSLSAFSLLQMKQVIASFKRELALLLLTD